MKQIVELRRGAYQDSVTLMQLSRELQQRPEVSQALIAMATELNLDLLGAMGFSTPTSSSPNDMIVAIEAADKSAVVEAVQALDAALARPPSMSGLGSGTAPAPPTVSTAARRVDADLALISTPGRVAVLDAVDALEAGLDVMIFSDNVTVEHEIALKELATRTGNLVMGPDCGTAVVGGVGLGFANVVRPGPVGIVAASGTGAQHLLALLDGAGIGVRHCLGVGGRDMSREVQGRSTLAALDRLANDDEITFIVVISKPPAPDVADAVAAHAKKSSKTIVMGTLGPGRPDLTATAARVVDALGHTWTAPPRWGQVSPSPRQGFVRGLFSGGTLCDEAMLIAADVLGPIASNIPLSGHPPLGPTLRFDGHTFLDFGDDQLTVGRPHPMIDATLRLERLRAELVDPMCAVVLLDVVLGHGSDPDPATELVDALATSDTPVIISLVGTRDDPQGRDETAARLAERGAIVHASNAAATREAIATVTLGDV